MTDTPVTPEDVAATAQDEADAALPAPDEHDHDHEHHHEPKAPSAADLPPGVYVQPGETGFLLQTQAMPDGRVWVVARVEHATGSTVLPLPPAFARQFGMGLLDESARAASVEAQIKADREATAAKGKPSRLVGADGQPLTKPADDGPDIEGFDE